MSISSGYPVGARITSKLRQEGLCTSIEGQRLLSLCSTSGPLFIIGAVATGIMKNPALGFFLAISHYLSALSVGFLMRYYGKEKTADKRGFRSNPIADMLDYRKKDGRPIGMLLGDAVKNGVNMILMIGGFVIFFTVIASMLKTSGLLQTISVILSKAVPFDAATPDVIASFLIGFLEVTNGAKETALLQVPLIYKIIMVSFMIGFGGLSINAQVMSIIAETDLKFSIYFFFKLLQGIFASIYSYIFVIWFSDLEVFNSYFKAGTDIWNSADNANFISTLINSSIYLLLILTFMSLIFVVKNKRDFFLN
jgi:sporulation integral membrane protein YlbJ